MQSRKLITRPLIISLLLLSGSCATSTDSVATPSLYVPPPPCSGDGSCGIAEAMSASIETMRAKGDMLKIACDMRIEKRVDGPYMAACKQQIESLAIALSGKWPNELAAIDSRTIRYDWKAWDCIDGVDFGFCRYYGIAHIPLSWTAAPPNNSFKPKPLRGSA